MMQTYFLLEAFHHTPFKVNKYPWKLLLLQLAAVLKGHVLAHAPQHAVHTLNNPL